MAWYFELLYIYGKKKKVVINLRIKDNQGSDGKKKKVASSSHSGKKAFFHYWSPWPTKLIILHKNYLKCNAYYLKLNNELANIIFTYWKCNNKFPLYNLKICSQIGYLQLVLCNNCYAQNLNWDIDYVILIFWKLRISRIKKSASKSFIHLNIYWETITC